MNTAMMVLAWFLIVGTSALLLSFFLPLTVRIKHISGRMVYANVLPNGSRVWDVRG